MADYDRRLQRLEQRTAAPDDGDNEFAELCRKRTAELLASKEVQAWIQEHPEPDISEAEWAAEWEAGQAEHAEELAKARRLFASLAMGHGKT